MKPILRVLVLLFFSLFGLVQASCTSSVASKEEVQEEQLQAIFEQVAVYTVDVSMSCDDGHGLINWEPHECTSFGLEGGLFVCKGEGYPNGELRLPPDTGCYFHEPTARMDD